MLNVVGAAMTSLLHAALDYAARGYSVVPLHTPTPQGCSCWKGPHCGRSTGRHPRIEWKPYEIQRATAEEIRAWWTEWPLANVGIITGTISQLAVLDIDPRNGGWDTVAELDARDFVLPWDNPLVETGSLGLHHYFVLDQPLAKAAPMDGIEVQADGALVVAPPSLHVSGRRYRWLRDLAHPLPPLPSWVRWVCRQVTPEPAITAPILDADQDNVLGALQAADLYLGRHRRDGLHRIVCPWADQHSAGGDREAVVIEPGHSAAPGWAFKCLHEHCLGLRSIGDVLDYLAIPRRRSA